MDGLTMHFRRLPGLRGSAQCLPEYIDDFEARHFCFGGDGDGDGGDGGVGYYAEDEVDVPAAPTLNLSVSSPGVDEGAPTDLASQVEADAIDAAVETEGYATLPGWDRYQMKGDLISTVAPAPRDARASQAVIDEDYAGRSVYSPGYYKDPTGQGLTDLEMRTDLDKKYGPPASAEEAARRQRASDEENSLWQQFYKEEPYDRVQYHIRDSTLGGLTGALASLGMSALMGLPGVGYAAYGPGKAAGDAVSRGFQTGYFGPVDWQGQKTDAEIAQDREWAEQETNPEVVPRRRRYANPADPLAQKGGTALQQELQSAATTRAPVSAGYNLPAGISPQYAQYYGPMFTPPPGSQVAGVGDPTGTSRFYGGQLYDVPMPAVGRRLTDNLLA